MIDDSPGAPSPALVQFEELILAYRRAKVDLYYATHARRFDLVKYEESLEANLARLLELLNRPDSNWVRESEFLGDFTVVPKTLNYEPRAAGGFTYSDSARTWEQTVRTSKEPPQAEFRVMSRCSIDMHVLSTLWLMRVGSKYDAQLDATAHGGRLRKRMNSSRADLRSGSFPSYLHAYRRWRDQGLDSIRRSIDDNKSVVVMTADATSFYHSIDAAFLVDEAYNQSVMSGVSLSVVEGKLHDVFVESIQAWSSKTAESLGVRSAGLPVGLPASALVANLALAELDSLVREELKPIYYGRYIDDIILVLEASENILDPQGLQEWLVDRSRGRLMSVAAENGELNLHFSPPYHSSSQIRFTNSKNRTFLIEGQSGQHLVQTIARTIDERNSEWRSLPQMTPDPRAIGADIAAITRQDGGPATSIGEVSGVTARRAEFAIRLRNFESYARDLPPREWDVQRDAFYRTICTHIFTLPNLFDFASYLPRLIKLATNCGDVKHLAEVIGSVCAAMEKVVEDCSLTIAKLWDSNEAIDSEMEVSERLKLLHRVWAQQFEEDVIENIAAGLPEKFSSDDLAQVCSAFKSSGYSFERIAALELGELRSLHSGLFIRDLAHVPFRFSILPVEIVPFGQSFQNVRDRRNAHWLEVDLPNEIVEGVNLLLGAVGIDQMVATESGEKVRLNLLHAPFVFPTRPLTMQEVCLAYGNFTSARLGFPKASWLAKVLYAMRGHAAAEGVPRVTKNGRAKQRFVRVPRQSHPGKIKVSLAMVRTTIEEFVQAAHGRPNISYARYNELTAAFNDATSPEKRGHYLVLGELGLPSRWFLSFSRRLGAAGVDLIAGVEYLGDGKGGRHNQVWAALTVAGGAPADRQIVYRQDKQVPAHFEERLLREQVGVSLRPKLRWSVPPVIVHGDFHFAILICSELTNIAHRASLRGKVDALIVPEWNKDLTTFNALVESAANDVHAYIVQVNNLVYGDSRIRAPRKESYERDIVQLRGGTHNYVVTGEIDYRALRDHQTRHRFPDGDFKPVPDGFNLLDARKYLKDPK